MRRQIKNILAILLLVSYDDQRAKHEASSPKAASLQAESTELRQEIVTKEFIDLIKFIDSSGFKHDSARFLKTYKEVNQSRPIKADGYLFYELKLDETVPIIEPIFISRKRMLGRSVGK